MRSVRAALIASAIVFASACDRVVNLTPTYDGPALDTQALEFDASTVDGGVEDTRVPEDAYSPDTYPDDGPYIPGDSSLQVDSGDDAGLDPDGGVSLDGPFSPGDGR